MGTNGKPLASDGSCIIKTHAMRSLSIDRAYRFRMQISRTSLTECRCQQHRLAAYFPNLTLMILLHHHTHPTPAPAPAFSTFSYQSTYADRYHGSSAASIAKGDCEMQRLEEACFDMAEISQLYWCTHRSVGTFALSSPRMVLRMAQLGLWTKGRFRGGNAAAAVLALLFSFHLWG